MHLNDGQESRNQMEGKYVLLSEWMASASVVCVYAGVPVGGDQGSLEETRTGYKLDSIYQVCKL